MKPFIALDLDSKSIRSYASQAFLMNSKFYLDVMDLRHIVCRTPAGRWTAVFIGADAINRVLHGGTRFAIVG